jgi:hypothetical protein
LLDRSVHDGVGATFEEFTEATRDASDALQTLPPGPASYDFQTAMSDGKETSNARFIVGVHGTGDALA